MTYIKPELTLIGQASGVVLGGGVTLSKDNNQPCQTSANSDCIFNMEAEW